MLQSMTGYGAAKIETPTKTLKVEIKSLNSKGLDLSIRLPRALAFKEMELRNHLGLSLNRGKVNVSVDYEAGDGSEAGLALNKPVLKQWISTLKQIANEEGMDVPDAALFKTALNMPSVMGGATEEASEEDWGKILEGIAAAMIEFNAYRSSEGAALEAELLQYVRHIGTLLVEVDQMKEQRLPQIRTQITTKLKEWAEGMYDGNRLEQEMVYYAEKLDITEEIVRLRTHLDYFEQTISNDPAPGKKLGFISQELGREINTIGSKANHAEIQKIVVVMKEELEKIKEQVLNII